MSFVKTIFSKIKKYVPTGALVIFMLGLVSAGLYIAFLNSPDFADFFNRYISSVFRRILAYATALFPFSVAESFIFCLPILVFLFIRFAFRYIDTHEAGFTRCVATLLSVLVLFFSVFTINFSAGYRGSELDEKLGLDTSHTDEVELLETAVLVAGRLNYLAEKVTFTENGSVRGYTHDDTVDKLCESYDKLKREYPFIDSFKAPVKRLAVSNIMTYTHISGVYTFFTGEANLNTNYPEFVNVFTVAHEMAHQRGVARENEANFVAYLVCINSEDPYLQYAGYLNMLEYLVSAVSKTSEAGAKKLYSALDERIFDELRIYSEFFDKYRDSTASEISGAVNDSYLQSQGTAGTVSYSIVVELAVAYHNAER